MLSHKSNYTLVSAAQRFSWLVTFLLKNPTVKACVLTGTEKQKQFFQQLLPQFGVKLDTAQIMTVAECDIKEDTQVTLLMDVPPSFEELQKIYDASRDSKLVLVLLAGNAAYAKVLSKKTNSEIHQLAYNPNKLISTESKLIRLVEASYHLNRLAFYAYGSYLQYFSANLFKSIFNTQALDVAAVARGFGFQVPPRVIAKPGQFLNRKAQDRKKREKREQRRNKVKGKQASTEQPEKPEQHKIQSLPLKKRMILKKKMNLIAKGKKEQSLSKN